MFSFYFWNICVLLPDQKLRIMVGQKTNLLINTIYWKFLKNQPYADRLNDIMCIILFDGEKKLRSKS